MPHSMSLLSKAQKACSYCRRQKRRCDKQTPSCTTCQRAERHCEYADDKQEDVHNLRSRLDDLERLLASQASGNGHGRLSTASGIGQSAPRAPATGPDATRASFPSAWFLDIDCFEKMEVGLPRPSMPASGSILEELGSPEMWRNIINLHFSTTHIWLPIIWRRKMETLVSNHNTQLPSSTALLLASMKIVNKVPDEAQHPSQSRLYIVLKQELSAMENQGYISIGLLQAAILTTVYEMAHSIYPAAYLSIGRCVNIAHVMGLHDRNSAPQATSKPNFWSETEELTRVWCAILVLDRQVIHPSKSQVGPQVQAMLKQIRYINLGSRQRPLMSGEFAEDEILPCDTSSWDRGEPSASIPLFLTSATTLKTDAFARTCQVAHLVGHIFRHRDDKALTGPYRFTSAKQLLATLDSLLGLLASEAESNPVAFGSPYAMALGCKMIFLDIYVCTETNGRTNSAEETELQAIALDTYRDLMHEAERLAKRLFAIGNTEPLHMWSQGPFAGHCFYQGALTAAWYLNESGAEEMRGVLDTFLLALDQMNKRWRVAGQYKNMVEITERLSQQSLASDLMSA